jgi:hypothetical protein
VGERPYVKEDRMPETQVWVHGNVFVPGNYGPDHLAQVDGISWTDIQGQKLGHQATFVMKDEKVNFFHAPIPVLAESPKLLEVRVQFSAAPDSVRELWIHAGLTKIEGPRTDFKLFGGPPIITLSLDGIDKPVTRGGISLSLGFSTEGPIGGNGRITFYTAGARLLTD